MNDDTKTDKAPRRGARRNRRRFVCHLCKREVPFAWNCKCGFMICPQCMEENKPLMSNDVIWICPDCEEIRSF